MRTSSVYSLADSISAPLLPSLSETKKQRARRLKAEAEAKRLSDQIVDEQLKQERLNKSSVVKLLLLGQAESGKTTLIKQFQHMYKPHRFEQERVSWKAVIYFNVVASLKHILTTLEACDDIVQDDIDYCPKPHSRKPVKLSDKPTSLLDAGASRMAGLRRRLGSLVSADELTGSRLTGQDILVQGVAHMLWNFKKDIKELWDHTTVKALITTRKLKLNEQSDFFLNHISRIVDPDYVPTTDDILHASSQTMGIQEHVFDVNIYGKTATWHMYDVGGARGKRHSWVPYFDNINVIIFVAPISDFDQYLEEDPRINRIADSLQLFSKICSNRLLQNAHILLILNKINLLKAKLDKGVKVRKYITSFGERSNDYHTVIQYLLKHFLDVYRRNSGNGRLLNTHIMNVIDTKAPQFIVPSASSLILQGYLRSSGII